MFSDTVAAGFPSPATDFLEETIDLNRHLITNPPATFLVRVAGDSMIEAGIHSGDLLIVDRSITPASGRVVVAALNGELTVKRLKSLRGTWLLTAESPGYADIPLTESIDLVVWGVVTYAVHEVSRHG
ncbi:MAG: LexA family protein [Gemmatimonadaceae bacterium]